MNGATKDSCNSFFKFIPSLYIFNETQKVITRHVIILFSVG